MSALDTDLRRVFVYCENDNNLYYHHRVLVVQGPDGKWVGFSPTLEVQLIDLAQLAGNVTPLRRGQPFPSSIPSEEIFGFDPLDPATEDRLRDECHDFATLLGFVQAPPVTARHGRWVVADTASELFAQVVPEDALADQDLTVIRDECGLVRIDGSWLLMQKVTESERRWRSGPAKVGTLGSRAAASTRMEVATSRRATPSARGGLRSRSHGTVRFKVPSPPSNSSRGFAQRGTASSRTTSLGATALAFPSRASWPGSTARCPRWCATWHACWEASPPPATLARHGHATQCPWAHWKAGGVFRRRPRCEAAGRLV